MDKSKECVPFALFCDHRLDLRHGSVIEKIVGELSRLHHWFNPHRQPIHRLAHGLTEVVLFLPVHCPFKGSTNIGAGQPEVDIVGFVGHEIL
jgi:hypothetical protein